MPSNQSPLGAKSARFRRTRLLLVGCGDVGERVLKLLPHSVQVTVLTRQPQAKAALRSDRVRLLPGDLAKPHSLRRLAGIGQRVLHLAPPPGAGADDPHTRALLQALLRRSPPLALAYASTTGVYGDRGGQWLHEHDGVRPGSDRAVRRVAAEGRMRHFGRLSGTRVSLLRIPGIYAANRAGGPAERVAKGLPVLTAADDVYTNHIHADDLARACWLALWRGLPQRAINVCDDTQLKMGDYFDAAADALGLARPPRVSRAQAQSGGTALSPMALSFMAESRRVHNTRLKAELRLALRYPTVQAAWAVNR